MGSPAEAGAHAQHIKASVPGRWDSQGCAPGLWHAQGCLCMEVGIGVAGSEVGSCGMGSGVSSGQGWCPSLDPAAPSTHSFEGDGSAEKRQGWDPQ